MPQRVDMLAVRALEEMLEKRDFSREAIDRAIVELDEKLALLYQERNRLRLRYARLMKKRIDLKAKIQAISDEIVFLQRQQRLCKHLRNTVV